MDFNIIYNLHILHYVRISLYNINKHIIEESIIIIIMIKALNILYDEIPFFIFNLKLCTVYNNS